MGYKKVLYSRYILEIKLRGIKCESNVFDLRNWKIKLPLPKMKKLKEADVVGKTRISSLYMLSLKCLLDIHVEL